MNVRLLLKRQNGINRHRPWSLLKAERIMKGLALNRKELFALQEKPVTKEQKEAKMETKKLFIIVLVVIFGICFITTLSSIQRMDSDQMMVDPENP